MIRPKGRKTTSASSGEFHGEAAAKLGRCGVVLLKQGSAGDHGPSRKAHEADPVGREAPLRGMLPNHFERLNSVPMNLPTVSDPLPLVLSKDGRVTAVNRSEFARVPEEAKMGSVIENEDGHWITYTPGKGEDRNQPLIRLANGRYFVLGDNRDKSADSRAWGPISEGSIVGKVIMKLPTGLRQ